MKMEVSFSMDNINDLLSFYENMSRDNSSDRQKRLCYATGEDGNGAYLRAFLNSRDRDVWVSGGEKREKADSTKISPAIKEMARETFDKMHNDFMEYMGSMEGETVDLVSFVQNYRAFDKSWDFGKAYHRSKLIYTLLSAEVDRNKAEEIVDRLLDK